MRKVARWSCSFAALATFMALISVSLDLKAQSKSDEIDYVTLHLKKGIVVRGLILEFVPGEFTRLRTTRGDTLSIDDKHVRKYVFPKNRLNQGPDLNPYSFSENGFYQAYSVGMILNTVSSEDGGLVGYELTAAAGYMHNRWLGLGGGLGADFYHRAAGEMIFPLYAEVRGYLLAQPSSPYYILRSGYGFAFKNEDVGIEDAQGGWMINPAIGWRLGDQRGLKMTLDIGVKFQHATFDYRDGSTRSQADLLYKRLNLRLGFLF